MRQFLTILFISFISLIINSCDDEIEYSVVGGIYGVITDASTVSPIKGASVVLTPTGASTVTSSDGAFDFAGLEAQQYSVAITASGYASYSRTVTAIAGKSVNCDVSLTQEVEVEEYTVSTEYLSFGVDDSEKTFTIINTSSSSSSYWSITDIDADWITVSPTSGSIGVNGSSVVKVSIDRDKITEDVSSYFIVNATGGSKQIEVSVIAAKDVPILEVDESTLDFGENLSVEYFTITNLGTQSMSFEFLSVEDWFSVECSSSTLDAGKSTMAKVTIDRDKLTESKTHKLIVSSDGGTASITLNVTKVEIYAELAIDVTSLDFGETTTVRYFTVKNDGTADLTFEFLGVEDWFDVACSKYTLTSGDSTTITVTLDRDNLTQSESHELIVSSNVGNQSVTLNATYVAKYAELSIDVTSLDFGETTTVRYFTVKNDGTADLTFEFLGIDDWFDVTCSKYTLTSGESTIVIVTIDRDELTQSESHELIVSSNAGNQSVTLNATYVAKYAELSIDVTSLDFGETTTVRYFTVKNDGTADLTFAFEGVDDWFDVTCSKYTLTSGESAVVTVTLDRDKLTQSESHELIVCSNVGNQSVTLNATYVAKYAELSIDVTSLDFGETNTVKYFTVKNDGTADLTFEFLGVEDWFDVACSKYTLPSGDSTTITVTLDRDNLTQSKSHELIVSSNVGNQSVTLNATYVAKYAELSVTPTTLDFGETSTVKYITVKNNGTADLTFEFLGVEDWFSATSSKYTLTSGESTTVTVTLDRSKVLSATSGTLVVSSNGGNANVELSASVYIPTPTLTLYATEVDFGESLTTQTFTVYNTGDAAMTFSVNESLSWLSTSYTGSVAAGSSTVVTLTLDRSSIYGEVSEAISITSDGGSASLTVKAYEPIDYSGVGVTVTDIEVFASFNSVSTSGTNVTINFTVTNNGSSSKYIEFGGTSFQSTYPTYAFDNLGNFYDADDGVISITMFGNTSTRYSKAFTLSAGSSVSGSITISGVSTAVAMLTEVQFYFRSPSYGTLKFTNVPIIR